MEIRAPGIGSAATVGANRGRCRFAEVSHVHTIYSSTVSGVYWPQRGLYDVSHAQDCRRDDGSDVLRGLSV